MKGPRQKILVLGEPWQVFVTCQIKQRARNCTFLSSLVLCNRGFFSHLNIHTVHNECYIRWKCVENNLSWGCLLQNMYTEASLQHSYGGHTGSQMNSKVKHPRLNIVLGVVTSPYTVTQRLVEPTSRRSSIAGVGERLSCTNSS